MDPFFGFMGTLQRKEMRGDINGPFKKTVRINITLKDLFGNLGRLSNEQAGMGVQRSITWEKGQGCRCLIPVWVD